MNKKQSGMSALEVIMAIVIIGLIGALAYVYVNNTSTDKNYQQDNNSTSYTARNTDEPKKSEEDMTKDDMAKKYLEIPELKLRIPDADGTLTYTYEAKLKGARITTNALMKKVGDCKTGGIVIVTGKANEQVPRSGAGPATADPSNTFEKWHEMVQKDTDARNWHLVSVKVGDMYFSTFRDANYQCSAYDTSIDKTFERSEIDKVKKLLKSAERM